MRTVEIAERAYALSCLRGPTWWFEGPLRSVLRLARGEPFPREYIDELIQMAGEDPSALEDAASVVIDRHRDSKGRRAADMLREAGWRARRPRGDGKRHP